MYSASNRLSEQEIQARLNEIDPYVWRDEDIKSEVSDFKCPSCGYKKARILYRQIRGMYKGTSDFIIKESLKCLKCQRSFKSKSEHSVIKKYLTLSGSKCFISK